MELAHGNVGRFAWKNGVAMRANTSQVWICMHFCTVTHKKPQFFVSWCFRMLISLR